MITYLFCVVIAIDIDPRKIELAQHNAQVYGVADRIEFICGDFFALAPKLKADVAFLSPPWGGPEYSNLESYELEEMLKPAPLSKLMQSARAITENIALFLPRNSNTFHVSTILKVEFHCLHFVDFFSFHSC